MAKYDLEEDIKIYKDNRAKSLLCTRAILSVVFIVLFILGQNHMSFFLLMHCHI